jgi:hypothetical protein
MPVKRIRKWYLRGPAGKILGGPFDTPELAAAGCDPRLNDAMIVSLYIDHVTLNPEEESHEQEEGPREAAGQ